jgi:hypothetical protein
MKKETIDQANKQLANIEKLKTYIENVKHKVKTCESRKKFLVMLHDEASTYNNPLPIAIDSSDVATYMQLHILKCEKELAELEQQLADLKEE